VLKSVALAIFQEIFLKDTKLAMTARFAEPFHSDSFVWETSAPTSAHQHTVGMEVSSDGS
jgi:hypothetical protein